jgi:hypothetical protein
MFRMDINFCTHHIQFAKFDLADEWFENTIEICP